MKLDQSPRVKYCPFLPIGKHLLGDALALVLDHEVGQPAVYEGVVDKVRSVAALLAVLAKNAPKLDLGPLRVQRLPSILVPSENISFFSTSPLKVHWRPSIFVDILVDYRSQ